MCVHMQSETPQFELSIETANALLQEAGLPPARSVKRINGGVVNDTFSIDDRYVIKIFSGYSEIIGRAGNEERAYRLAKEAEIPVPEVYFSDDVRKVIPYEYLITEFIQGVSLKTIWEDLSPEEKKSYLKDLGAIAGKLHRVRLPDFGDQIEGGIFERTSSFQFYFQQRVTDMAGKLRTFKTLPKEKISAIEKYFQTAPIFQITPLPSLVHRNFVFNNILAKDGVVQGIIDWEWSCAGHSEEDLSSFFYRGLKMNKEHISIFLDSYSAFHSVDAGFNDRIWAYNLLYYIWVLPYAFSIRFTSQKQAEYLEQTEKLFDLVVQ